jgi:DNA-binding MarR family transcriptional regulator
MADRRTREIDYAALADFRYEIRRFLSFSQRAAIAAGIKPQQHQALLAIKGQFPAPETTVGALAERLQIRHHSAVELSGRLEARGWIRRARSRTDGREVLLRLSPRSDRLLKKLSLSHRDELRTAGPRLLQSLRAAIAHGEQSRVLDHSFEDSSPGCATRPRLRSR